MFSPAAHTAGIQNRPVSVQRAFAIFSKVVGNRSLPFRKVTTEQNLVEWVRRQGGQADVLIEAPAVGGPRGVLAQRSFSPNEVVMSIPESMAIPFEGSPEEATVLLLHLKHNRQRREQYRPWLDALPGPEDFIAWDSVDDQALSMLQCPEMESAVRERRERLEAVWQREDGQSMTYSRQNLLPSRDIHWNEVQWAANVVRSRNWTMGVTLSDEPVRVMMPLFDMVNHDRASDNRIRYREGAFELIHEGDGIKAGQEIKYSYEGEGHELRNDQAALDYCFMLPHLDDSRLFHVDALASLTACGEDALEDLSTRELEAEHAQMHALLKDFPTTLQQDREILDRLQRADGPGTAEMSFLIEIRAARKAALGAHLRSVENCLQLHA